MKKLTGIVICFIIAVVAWLLGMKFPVVGGPVFGILIGMVTAKLVDVSSFKEGIVLTAKKLLQFSIILLGFEMNLMSVLRVGSKSLLVMIFTLGTAFGVAYIASKALKIDKNSAILVGAGTSICGGSAIAAAAPIIRAKDEEVAKSISVIFLFNIAAVFIFPALGKIMHLSDVGFGMWAGTAVNDTSSVVATGSAWSQMVGNDVALKFATIVKLTRTLMIIPVSFILAAITGREMKANAESQSGECEASKVKISKIFPWFVIGFLLAACICTFFMPGAKAYGYLGRSGKFIIVMAMSAIGLNTDVIELVKKGKKPIVLGLCCWIAVASVSILVQYFMKML